jgi:protein-serine/threonine kinase
MSRQQRGPGTTLASIAISPVLGTTTTTYTGSTVSLPVARRKYNNAAGFVASPTIQQGWATVKEGSFITAWKERYLVLRKEWLDFCKAEGGKSAYTLFMRDVVYVGRVETGTPILEIKRKGNGASSSPGEKEGDLRVLHIRLKTDDSLYTWMDLIHGACPGLGGVSSPTNFSHAVHVGFNPITKEFVGLPHEWVQLLSASAITKEDYVRNPQAVIEAVDFYSDLTKKSGNPEEYLALSPTPATRLREELDEIPDSAPATAAPAKPSSPAVVDKYPSHVANDKLTFQQHEQKRERSQEREPNPAFERLAISTPEPSAKAVPSAIKTIQPLRPPPLAPKLRRVPAQPVKPTIQQPPAHAIADEVVSQEIVVASQHNAEKVRDVNLTARSSTCHNVGG